MPAIVVSHLTKSYGDLTAVDDVSFAVEEGDCVALLGPNGAGKTTTVEILEGHRDRDAGEVTVLGMDPATGGRPLRERIGIVLQEAGIEEQFTVRELLALQRSLYPRRRDVDDVIDLVGLAEKADERIATLSGGQQRRVDLALGIIGDPDLIFLDEPTTGFDPAARRQAWGLVDALRSLGKTILLTTHYMDEAQQLADRVIVISAGSIVAEGTPEELASRSSGGTVLSFRLPPGTEVADLPPLGTAPDVVAGHVEVRTQDPMRHVHELTAWALEREVQLADLQLQRPSLEDVYLELVDLPAGEGATTSSPAPAERS